MIENFNAQESVPHTPAPLEIDPGERAALVSALAAGSAEAWVMMGDMMDKLESQIEGNSAAEMCAIFIAQAAMYFDSGLVDAGISSLNDAHVYAHNKRDEVLASTIRDEITARGGIAVYDL